MPDPPKIRLDKYLWAIRLYKTRSQASEACEKGRVKYLGQAAKASKHVRVGEEYDVKTEARIWRIQIAGLLDKRVPFSAATAYYTDLTPAEEIQRQQFLAASFQTGKRLSKVGRPTKKQRRDLEDFMEE